VNRLGKVITSKQKTLITSSITNHDLLPAELRRPCGISPDLVKESEDLSLSAPTPGSINQSPHPSSPVNEVGESEVVGIKNQDGLTNISTLDVNNRIKNNRLDWVFKDILQNEKLKGTLLNFTFIKQLKTIRTRTYKIEHLILISLISFLLGSILRSFLLPNDFIIFIPSSASSPTLKQLNAHDEDSLSSETKFIQILLERNNWKKIKRLIELKIKLKNLNVNWNLFIGIIRN
ncbi:hypothetical protein O181_085229, partial [Austropuccinia psidii MF-1]|nr:hypothetical protein [Austropuccinia psidii MF-1]